MCENDGYRQRLLSIVTPSDPSSDRHMEVDMEALNTPRLMLRPM